MPENNGPQEKASRVTLLDLILVAGHALFKKEIEVVPDHPERDAYWSLRPFQSGEPPLLIEHIRRGALLLANNPVALLIFSGGHTRAEGGMRWSEARTYLEIARHFKWWVPGSASEYIRVVEHSAVEEYARDSFENLLFGMCRFHQVVGRYPKNVTVISWAFKKARFDLHRSALRFPQVNYRFEGFNDPPTLDLESEVNTLRHFGKSRYGGDGNLVAKRAERNPFDERHDYKNCPGLHDFFEFIEKPENGNKEFLGRFPWEE
jgi:hypothetical protein